MGEQRSVEQDVKRGTGAMEATERGEPVGSIAKEGASSASIQPKPQTTSTMSRRELQNPLSFMRRFMNDVDELFSTFGFGSSVPMARALERLEGTFWSPAIETVLEGERLLFRVELPGLERKDVKVEIVGDELIISGQRTQDEREIKAGRVYTERRYGSFERRIALPEGCDVESIEACFDKGVLEVCVAVPSRKAPSSRTIEVKPSREASTESVH